MTTAEKLLTADEFAALPGPREGGKMELVHGRVVTLAPVGDEHGERAGDVYTPLREFARDHELGIVRFEVGFRLRRDPDLVRAPDVSFTETSALDPDRDRSRYIEGPPTLAVEVVSPGDRDADLSEKIAEYLAAGSQRVWVVRPRLRTVTVHRPGGDAHTYGMEDTLTSDDAGFSVEGFALPLRDVFR